MGKYIFEHPIRDILSTSGLLSFDDVGPWDSALRSTFHSFHSSQSSGGAASTAWHANAIPMIWGQFFPQKNRCEVKMKYLKLLTYLMLLI